VADDNKAADAKSRETTIAAAKPQSASSPGALISTAFTNIRTIHAFSMQDYVVDKYADITLERSKAREQKGVYGGLGFGGSNFVIFSIYALLFWYGSQLLKDEEITFEEMLIAMLTLMLGALGLGHALADLSDQTTAVQAAKRMFKIIDSSVDQSANPIDGFSEEGVTLPSGAEQGAAVALEHLTFRYPTRKEIKVWQDFSLAINSGEVIAFIGPSGCGKVSLSLLYLFTDLVSNEHCLFPLSQSTIINLLLRFYDAEAGNIMYNGEAISNLNVRWLRSQIG
jgi:ATP-binding cassette subfamily B (MDR/TAP) protein 1